MEDAFFFDRYTFYDRYSFSHKFYGFLDKPKWMNLIIFYALSNPYACFVSCYLNYIWGNLWNLNINFKWVAGREEKFVILKAFF